MMTFHVEHLKDCWDEFHALCLEFYASRDAREPVQFKQERYLQYQDAGVMHLLTARDSGRMVGLFTFYLVESMHTQLPVIREDLLYLTPSHRKGRNALRFMQYCEGYARSLTTADRPIQVILQTEQGNESGIKGLLTYLEYVPMAVIYTKYLSPRADSASPLADGVQHEAVGA